MAKDPKRVAAGKRAQRKGKHREDERAKEMTTLTGEEWERRGGNRDIIPRDPNSAFSDHHAETKGYKHIAAMRWQEQAERDGATRGKSRRIVIWREDALPGGKIPPSIVQLQLTEYIADQLELQRFRTGERGEIVDLQVSAGSALITVRLPEDVKVDDVLKWYWMRSSSEWPDS